MQVLMIILGVLAALVALLLIAAFFVRKEYSLEREVTIDRPLADVFGYIRLLRNQEQYNKWAMADPQKKTSFRGTDGTVGFVYAWDGNKQVGAGEQEIRSIREGERIDVEIRFFRPFAATAQAPFTTRALSENSTRLSWGMRSRMKYPMNIMLAFMNMEKMLGKDIDESLARVKNVLEARV